MQGSCHPASPPPGEAGHWTQRGNLPHLHTWAPSEGTTDSTFQPHCNHHRSMRLGRHPGREDGTDPTTVRAGRGTVGAPEVRAHRFRWDPCTPAPLHLRAPALLARPSPEGSSGPGWLPAGWETLNESPSLSRPQLLCTERDMSRGRPPVSASHPAPRRSHKATRLLVASGASAWPYLERVCASIPGWRVQ